MSATEKIHTDRYSLFKLNKEVSGNDRVLELGLRVDVWWMLMIISKGCKMYLHPFKLQDDLIEVKSRRAEKIKQAVKRIVIMPERVYDRNCERDWGYGYAAVHLICTRSTI